MKRFLIIIPLILVLCAPLQARELGEYISPYKFGVKIGWGSMPVSDITGSRGRFGSFSGWDDSAMYDNLEYIYGDAHGPVYMTGVLKAEFCYYVQRWLTVGLDVSTNGCWTRVQDAITGEFSTRSFSSWSVMPVVRFSWINRLAKLYGSFGIGYEYRGYLELSDYSWNRSGLSFQCVPLGVEVGNRVFGFFEAEAGTMYCGFSGGVGVRF